MFIAEIFSYAKLNRPVRGRQLTYLLSSQKYFGCKTFPHDAILVVAGCGARLLRYCSSSVNNYMDFVACVSAFLDATCSKLVSTLPVLNVHLSYLLLVLEGGDVLVKTPVPCCKMMLPCFGSIGHHQKIVILPKNFQYSFFVLEVSMREHKV